MIYVTDLQQLINSWQERVDSPVHSSSYKDGVMDCIYELNQLISKSFIDELTEEDAKQYLLQQEADNYLSSEENYYATAI